VFVDWFELNSGFLQHFRQKKEVKSKCKYKRATQEKERKKK
jgi:hypothetical protein